VEDRQRLLATIEWNEEMVVVKAGEHVATDVRSR
jgi:hypothetical protein